jgi:hypothetical protein
VYDVFVIKGNAAVFKCNIPSFVSDYVEIVSWQDTEGTQYPMASSYGTNAMLYFQFPLRQTLLCTLSHSKCHVKNSHRNLYGCCVKFRVAQGEKRIVEVSPQLPD